MKENTRQKQTQRQEENDQEKRIKRQERDERKVWNFKRYPILQEKGP
jgi:hypothetical protein